MTFFRRFIYSDGMACNFHRRIYMVVRRNSTGTGAANAAATSENNRKTRDAGDGGLFGALRESAVQHSLAVATRCRFTATTHCTAASLSTFSTCSTLLRPGIVTCKYIQGCSMVTSCMRDVTAHGPTKPQRGSENQLAFCKNGLDLEACIAPTCYKTLRSTVI